MIFTQGYKLEDLQRPNAKVYKEMITYIKETVSFFGAAGDMDFKGNDLPDILAVCQAQRDTAGAVMRKMVATVSVTGVMTQEQGASDVFEDGPTTPGSLFKSCPSGKILNVAGECEECPKGTYHDCAWVNGQCTGSQELRDGP